MMALATTVGSAMTASEARRSRPAVATQPASPPPVSPIPPASPETLPEQAPHDPAHTGGLRGLGRPREWEWRRRIRANPQSAQIYRSVVASVGLVVVVTGLVLVPFPGPGWLIVFIGVSIWASEFHWARRLHHWGIARLKVWNAWVMRQHLAVRGALAGLTCLFVWAAVWASIKLTGIPGWVPDDITSFLQAHLAL